MHWGHLSLPFPKHSGHPVMHSGHGMSRLPTHVPQ